ncbi:MAG: hypothetical protein ACLRSW_00325 [Christensenellaceae bacterium]
MLKSVEVARMLGYTVEEKGKRRRNGGYRIYHCFRRFTYERDIAEYIKIYRVFVQMGRQAPQVVTGDSGIIDHGSLGRYFGKINKFFNTKKKQARIYSPRLFSFLS